MKKYLTKETCNSFLLSLNLCEGRNNQEILKKLYSISNNVENNYQVFKIPKRNGGFRQIYEPNYNLKKIQRKILKNILESKKVSKYAQAYLPFKSLKDNARVHVNKKIILKLDIEDFFNSITFSEVISKCFPYEYYPDSISVLLTKLCTYYDYVPQGAPTSAYISNIVLKEFDETVGKFCEELNIDYTRYSDDLTFSGDFDYKNVIKFVEKELTKRGYLLNKRKIVVVSQKKRQSVTGIVVNQKMQVNIDYRKKIRQEMYYIEKFGLESHLQKLNINNQKSYLESLRGRINFCLQINPNDKQMQKNKNILKKIIDSL